MQHRHEPRAEGGFTRAGVAAPSGRVPENDLHDAENTLILACARSLLDRPQVLPAAAGVRWREFVSQLVRHGLHAPLHADVLAWYGDALPPEDAAALRGAARRAAARNLALVAALHEVDDAFQRAGIAYAVLKGLPLAQSLYGSITARGCTDLDLLVAPEAFAAARKALEAAGFTAAWGLDPAGERICARFAADMPYWRADGVLIELHRRIDVNPPSAGELCARGILETAAPIDVAGVTVPAAVGPAALPFLAWHGGNHGWTRLIWLLDVALIMARAEPEELESAWEAASPVRGRRPLALAWRLAEDWLEVPVPEPARAAAGSAEITRLVERITPAALGGERRAPVGSAGRRFAGLGWSLALADGPRVRAGILARYPIAVQPDDVRALGLPAGLAWLYPAVRPARLAVRATAALGAKRPRSTSGAV